MYRLNLVSTSTIETKLEKTLPTRAKIFFYLGLGFTALLAFWLYLGALQTGFLADDFIILNHLKFKEPHFFDSFVYFTRDWGIGNDFYRPFIKVVWAAEYGLFGDSAGGWHLVGVLLYSANAALVYLLGWQLSWRVEVAAVAGLCFALHPAHVEPVTWIADQSDLWVGLFCLAGAIFYVRARQNPSRKARFWVNYLLALVCYVLALLNKESAATFFLVPLLYDVLFQPSFRRWLKPGYWLRLVAIQLPFWIILGLYIALRLALFKGIGGYNFSPTDWTFSLGKFITDYFGWLAMPLTPSRTLLRLALIGLLLLMIAGLIIREAGQRPSNQPDSKANPKLSFRLCRMALFGLIWAVWFVLPALSSPPGIRYTYLSTVGVALLMASLLAPVVQPGFMPSKTFFGIIRKSYDSLPVAGVKLLLVLGLAILSLLTIIPIQQQLAEASRVTRLGLDQLHTLYPSLENYSLVYGAGLPDLSVDYNSTLILNPGFNEAVQLSYNNPLVQGIRVGAFPVVEQRLNQTRFVEYRAGKLVDREDIGAALQARNRNIKDKKEYAAFTWDFSQPQPAAGSGQMSPESWAIVGGSGTLTSDPARRILRVELPNGGVFRPPHFSIGAAVLGNLELKLGAASLNAGSGNTQLIIHWLVETPGGLQERASAPLVIQADSLRHTYRLKPPDISAFLYDDKVSEIQIELSPGLASLEIEQARLYSLPEG